MLFLFTNEYELDAERIEKDKSEQQRFFCLVGDAYLPKHETKAFSLFPIHPKQHIFKNINYEFFSVIIDKATIISPYSN
jgi:hypothetical protein